MKTTLGLMAAASLLAAAPLAAHAQDSTYNGYCYAKKDKAKTTGTVIGAIVGGLAGSQISKNERGLGAVGGAVVGGAVGRGIGASSVKCMNGDYYSYQQGSYQPAPAPDGYQVVYYKDQPPTSAYSHIYYNRDRSYAYNNNSYGQAYNQAHDQYRGEQGWRDDRGDWHTGRPVAFGWKDTYGRWHEGQVQAYGYKDSDGRWHESSAPSYGYNDDHNYGR
jgi:uncharacterized protein YcfJ